MTFKLTKSNLRRVASNISLEAEELSELTNSIFNILAAAAPTRISLPVYEGVLKGS